MITTWMLMEQNKVNKSTVKGVIMGKPLVATPASKNREAIIAGQEEKKQGVIAPLQSNL